MEDWQTEFDDDTGQLAEQAIDSRGEEINGDDPLLSDPGLFDEPEEVPLTDSEEADEDFVEPQLDEPFEAPVEHYGMDAAEVHEESPPVQAYRSERELESSGFIIEDEPYVADETPQFDQLAHAQPSMFVDNDEAESHRASPSSTVQRPEQFRLMPSLGRRRTRRQGENAEAAAKPKQGRARRRALVCSGTLGLLLLIAVVAGQTSSQPDQVSRVAATAPSASKADLAALREELRSERARRLRAERERATAKRVREREVAKRRSQLQRDQRQQRAAVTQPTELPAAVEPPPVSSSPSYSSGSPGGGGVGVNEFAGP